MLFNEFQCLTKPLLVIFWQGHTNDKWAAEDPTGLKCLKWHKRLRALQFFIGMSYISVGTRRCTGGSESLFHCTNSSPKCSWYEHQGGGDVLSIFISHWWGVDKDRETVVNFEIHYQLISNRIHSNSLITNSFLLFWFLYGSSLASFQSLRMKQLVQRYHHWTQGTVIVIINFCGIIRPKNQHKRKSIHVLNS